MYLEGTECIHTHLPTGGWVNKWIYYVSIMLYTYKAKFRESQLLDMCSNLVNFKDM